MPKYVFVVINKDILQEINYFDFGVADLLDECMQWLVKQFDKIFEIQREDLTVKKSGALATATEPRIVWLAMIQHLLINNHFKHVYNKRGKFNRAVKDAIRKYRYHHIMYLDNLTDQSHFDQTGKLTGRGKYEMWSKIIHQFRLFDAEELHLKPRPRKSNGRQEFGMGDTSSNNRV